MVITCRRAMVENTVTILSSSVRAWLAMLAEKREGLMALPQFLQD
jgi:hypothetical protein